MLDLEKPWEFMKVLNEWIDVLTEKISNINIPLDKLDNMRNKGSFFMI